VQAPTHPTCTVLQQSGARWQQERPGQGPVERRAFLPPAAPVLLPQARLLPLPTVVPLRHLLPQHEDSALLVPSLQVFEAAVSLLVASASP